MSTTAIHAVTGAFGFTGKYIARRLIEKDVALRTLTNSPIRGNPFGSAIDIRPLDFEPAALERNLHGVAVLYNTYWVRFNHNGFSFESATRHLLGLFEAARRAGVQRVVHISITNPSLDSPYEYFRGKAKVEQALVASGISHAILRPAVLFGREGLLFNNIAWLLRRFPIFAVFGRGDYRIRPIYVDDLAELAIAQAAHRENVIIDAVGPETFTYRQLVRTIASRIGKTRPFVTVPPGMGFLAARLIGGAVNDVLLTREEILALMDDLLYVDSPAAGATRFTDWAELNSTLLGSHYQSEIKRRIR